MMSHVLHDWDDGNCLRLLQRCHETLPSGAPLLVMEFLLDEDKMGPFLAAMQWLWLVLGTHGDQRTGAGKRCSSLQRGLPRHPDTSRG